MMPCTCGKTEVHVVSERHTADGIRVVLWSDGEVTGGMGFYPRGLGHLRHPGPRALSAGWLVMDEVCLYNWAEIARLVKTARKALDQICLPSDAYIRRSMAGEKFRFDGSVVVAR